MEYIYFGALVIYAFYLRLSSNAIVESISFVQKPEPQIGFTVVVPFHNASHTVIPLVKSLIDLEYDKNFFEVILINDNSNDGGEVLLSEALEGQKNFRLVNIYNKHPSKKNALYQGIKLSKFDWIVQTDADCTVNRNWLLCYNQIISKNSSVSFITGPVIFSQSSLFGNLQYLESFALIAGTSFGIKYNIPQMANAANMGWQKSTLTDLEIDDVYLNTGSSGDDYFLMMKIFEKKKNVIWYANFKDIIVESQSHKKIWPFIRQRLRWVSKYGKSQTISQKIFPLGIWLFHMMILFALGYFIAEGNLLILLIFFLVKFIFECFYIKRISSKYDLSIRYWDVFTQQFIYTPYTIFFGIGAFFNQDKWK